MNANRVKWFHRIVRWLGFTPVYSCRFVKDSMRTIDGSLEWRTGDLTEAFELWYRSRLYTGAKHGRFVFQVHLNLEASVAEGTQKQPTRDRRQIEFNLPQAVPSEANSGPHEPAHQEVEAHEAVRDSGGGKLGEFHLGKSSGRPHEPVVGGSKGQGHEDRPQGHEDKPSLSAIGIFKK